MVCLSVVWKNGWQIITPTKSFAVFAATATEKAEWMAHINKCIADLLAKSKDGCLYRWRSTVLCCHNLAGHIILMFLLNNENAMTLHWYDQWVGTLYKISQNMKSQHF